MPNFSDVKDKFDISGFVDDIYVTNLVSEIYSMSASFRALMESWVANNPSKKIHIKPTNNLEDGSFAGDQDRVGVANKGYVYLDFRNASKMYITELKKFRGHNTN